jgi:hypothetical protein
VGFGHIALMEWFGPRRLQCCSSSSLFESWNLCLGFVGSPNSVGRFRGGVCVYICSFENFWFGDDSQSLGWV